MLIFDLVPGLVAQRESVRLTRGRSLVRSQSGPPTVYLRQYPYARTVLSSSIFLGVRFLSGRESTVVVHSGKVGGHCVQLRVVKVAFEVGVWPQTVGIWRGGLWHAGWGVWSTSRAREGRACSPLSGSRRWWWPRWNGNPRMPPIGREPRWQPRPDCPNRPSGGSGKRSGLKPHQIDTFKLSNDPQFIDKVRDVVGLYIDPPEKAVVLCVDEKSQIQALDRSAPVLPMMPGYAPAVQPRLRAPRHYRAVRRAGCGHRPDHRIHPPPPPRHRIQKVLDQAGHPSPHRPGCPLDLRQLRHPQITPDRQMARGPSPLPHALHTHLLALVCV